MKKILLVEDEPLASILQSTLSVSARDVAVEVVNDGLIALRKIVLREADLVVLDLVTNSMDGFQLLDELVRKGVPAEVFVLSPLPNKEEQARAQSLGVLAYFPKDEQGLKDLSLAVGQFFASKQ